MSLCPAVADAGGGGLSPCMTTLVKAERLSGRRGRVSIHCITATSNKEISLSRYGKPFTTRPAAPPPPLSLRRADATFRALRVWLSASVITAGWAH
jgi:hypothetical protein